MEQEYKEYVLLKFSDTWADEIDIMGFTIYPKEKWDELKSILMQRSNTEIEFTVGSNQYITRTIGEFLDKFEVTVILEEASLIEKYFGLSYGLLPDLFDFLNDDAFDDVPEVIYE